MKSRPWYKHYSSDFIRGVTGLGPDVIGCYYVVIDLIYDHRGPVTNDPHFIGGILGCSTRKARSLITQLLDKGKLFQTPNGLSNMRAETEINLSVKHSRKLAENGSKGGRTRAENVIKSFGFNGFAQAPLKHRARAYMPEEDSAFFRGQSTTPVNGSASSKPEASGKVESIEVSAALAARYTQRRSA